VTPKVGAVGKGLIINLKNNIVDIKEGLDIGADSESRIKDHKTVVVIADAKLLFGAAHTVGGVARKLTGSDGDIADLRAELCKGNLESDGDVGCAANYVNELSFTDINLEKVELSRLGMLLDRLDLGYNDAGEVASLHKYFVFYLCGRERESLDKCELIKTGKVHVIAYPIHR
jgi:hypothetical protein